ncbi:5-formyltetrahydrofolate cyclo-ligase [Nocardioides piscis]|uniref:5-formyltetrahydrofolate cyclo-ligase n=1 Tax=Nocardioides piscis TaxID=2714938 RepID=A0A6G7YKD5_9ACTN|nr:5-formyltetrahydrofolate cyclo-ligase [Nocardioides piscis]
MPAKQALRDQVLAARRRRPLIESVAVAEAIADHVLAWDAVRRGAVVAAYVSVGREPGTGRLLELLVAAGKRVLLPVLCPDNDLDWVAFTGELAPASRGLLEPVGPRLGPDAIAQADVVIVPGLAASTAGDRLGRGGGSYDRALARVPAGVPIAVVLHEDEAGRDVPTQDHDRRVTHTVTPAGIS